MSRQFRAIAVAVALAAIAFVVISHRHQHGRNDAIGGSVNVLVATKLIRKGTPAKVMRTVGGYYTLRNITATQVETGAIVDPAALADKVALTNIDPGRQLTSAEFGPVGGTRRSRRIRN